MAFIKVITALLLVVSLSMGVTLNLQGGISFARIEFDKDNFFASYSPEAKPGPAFLLGVEYLERGEFNIASNIGIFRKSGGFANNFFKGSFSYDEGLTYLTINSLAEYKFKRWNRIKPFLSLGPRLDIVVHNDPFFEQLSQFNKYAFGLNCGGGVKYLIDPIVIGVRVDYYQNFTTIGRLPDNADHDGGEVEDLTPVLSLVIGYML